MLREDQLAMPRHRQRKPKAVDDDCSTTHPPSRMPGLLSEVQSGVLYLLGLITPRGQGIPISSLVVEMSRGCVRVCVSSVYFQGHRVQPQLSVGLTSVRKRAAYPDPPLVIPVRVTVALFY